MTENGNTSRWSAVKLLLSFVLLPAVAVPLIVYERLVWAKNRLLCLIHGHNETDHEPTIISDAYTSCDRCRKLLEVEDGTAIDWGEP